MTLRHFTKTTIEARRLDTVVSRFMGFTGQPWQTLMGMPINNCLSHLQKLFVYSPKADSEKAMT